MEGKIDSILFLHCFPGGSDCTAFSIFTTREYRATVFTVLAYVYLVLAIDHVPADREVRACAALASLTASQQRLAREPSYSERQDKRRQLLLGWLASPRRLHWLVRVLSCGVSQ